jgi:hypothetical protein
VVLRFQPPPAGQASAILIVIVGLCLLLLLRPARVYFRFARMRRLVALGPWRMIYGLALLVIGLSGGLPTAFFWTAAFGDIAIGLWSLVILSRGHNTSDGEVIAWNAAGLLDLVHVLILGALYLRGFYLAEPGIAPLNLLPLVGVPVFLALHVLTLWGLWARRGKVSDPRPA